MRHAEVCHLKCMFGPCFCGGSAALACLAEKFGSQRALAHYGFSAAACNAWHTQTGARARAGHLADGRAVRVHV